MDFQSSARDVSGVNVAHLVVLAVDKKNQPEFITCVRDTANATQASKFLTLNHSLSRKGTEEDLKGDYGALAPRHRVKSEEAEEERDEYDGADEDKRKAQSFQSSGGMGFQGDNGEEAPTNAFHYASPSKGTPEERVNLLRGPRA